MGHPTWSEECKLDTTTHKVPSEAYSTIMSLKSVTDCLKRRIVYSKSARVVLSFFRLSNFCAPLLIRSINLEALVKQTLKQLGAAGGIVPWNKVIIKRISFRISIQTGKSPMAACTTGPALSFREEKAFCILKSCWVTRVVPSCDRERIHTSHEGVANKA